MAAAGSPGGLDPTPDLALGPAQGAGARGGPGPGARLGPGEKRHLIKLEL